MRLQIPRFQIGDDDRRTSAYLAWVAVCLIWGTTYLGIKIALETIPPFLMGGIRYTTSGLVLAAWLLARGRRLPATRDWGRLAVLGFFMLMLGNGGVVWGEQFLPSGLTAVLIGTSPFWMVSVDAMLTGGRQLHGREWAGLFIGFAGIVILVWPDITAGGMVGRNFGMGVVAIQVACAGWAVGSAYTRRHVMPEDVLGSAALQMFFGGMFLLAAGTLSGEWPDLAFNPRTTAALGYLTLVGAVIAFAAYSYALKHLDMAIVSLYSYVNPIIAVALGSLILGEPFNVRMAVAIAIIAVGVMVVGPLTQKS
ncbi:MAG TPA: EamA family transporter [Vicinamibacterales bacterium]|nr:EamA family transporter [Vicinamibacterales bacterium]